MVIGLGDGGTAGDEIYVNFILFRRFTSSTLRSHSRHEDIQGVRTKKRCLVKCLTLDQGGRTWQPFVGGKNGHENFCQARIYNFRDKCVIFARNRKFANLTH